MTSIGSVAGSDAEKAPSVRLPSLADLKIDCHGRAIQRESGRRPRPLGRRRRRLPEIRKDGKPVQVSVSVVDSAGETTAQKSGTLADFGFS